MIEYIPSTMGFTRSNLPNQGSPWKGLETLLWPIIKDFGITPEYALEFGVEGGYSTAALAEHFGHVTAVDHFLGDVHSGMKDDPSGLERATRENLKQWPNIEVVTEDCFAWMNSGKARDRYGLAHIDIIHQYDETFAAALWACQRCDVVILHDTVSFPDVARACEDVAAETGRVFYGWPLNHGLGILVKQEMTR